MDLGAPARSAQRRPSRSLVRVRVLGALGAVSLMAMAIVACGPVRADPQALESSPPSGQPVLPIDLPGADVLHASPRKVFAHYMTTFPLSIDNEPPASDYYASQYLVPSGEDGKFAASGGFIRERPLTRNVSSAPSWQLDDMEAEVRRAAAAGIDGFTVDLLSLTGDEWATVQRLITAAHAVDPQFSILLMPDSTTDTVSDPNVLAAKIAGIAANPAVYHLADGRLVVSPFDAENKSAAWWQSWIALMKSKYGITVAFVPTFLDYGSAAAFSSFSYGLSVWGDRSPDSIVDTAAQGRDAHSRGKLWMQPIAVQDVRPTAGLFAESDNTATLRTLWQTAIDTNAEWVQLVTWNDYAECTEFSPSSHIGWSPLDISDYYLAWFKTSTRPTIVRDTVYLSHRIQPWAARPTGPQTELMELKAGSSPARDTVEVLTFLTQPQTVEVTIGGATHTYQAAAGESATTFPLAAGTVSATVRYSNGATLAIASADRVVDRPVVQDLQYNFASSGRDGVVSGVPPTSSAPTSSTPSTSPAPTSAPSTSPASTSPAATIPTSTTPAPSGIIISTTVPASTVPAAPGSFSGVAVGLPPVPASLRQH
ncbi:MAG: hypothetical protein JWN39_3116 [Ilumatobacteraceae bacterium]|nr:hypothetical protein [Ilumatobacteraceae bacterium]